VDSIANKANGFLLKDMQAQQLISSIRESASGLMMLPEIVAAKLVAYLQQILPEANHQADAAQLKKQGIDLTGREKDIANLMIKGMNNRQIAEMLSMSEGTVKNYISNVYGKIGVHERVKAVHLLQEFLSP
jgi:DNA-binding NarL/FixJ family response regulator